MNLGTLGTIQAGPYKGKHGKISRVDGYAVTLDDGKTVVSPFWNQSSFKPDISIKWGCNAIASYENTGLGTGLSRAKALGLTWDRPYAEDPTSISWWIDTVTRVNAAGLRPLVCIERRPYGADFPQAARALVAALRPYGVTHYEILNEPELAGITPSEYAKLYKATVLECRKADPLAKFIFASAPDVQVGANWVQWPTEAVKAVPDLGQFMDGWAVHPYGRLGNSSHSWGGGWNLLYYQHNQWLALGIDKPAWITEVGMRLGTSDQDNAGTEAERTARLNYYIAEVKSQPWIEAFFWFQWGDYGVNNQWGLTNDRNGSFRGTGLAYKNGIAP